MTLVSLADIERSFGEHVVLEGVSLSVDEGDRLGVIGDNGAGKTTLIKILAGIDEPDRGQRQTRRDLRIAYLQQIPRLEPGTTLRRYVERGDGTFERLAKTIEELAHALEARPDDPGLLEQYGHLQAVFEAGGGYERTHLCERVLSGIGFGEDEWGKDCAVLSGGEKTRLMLCALMTTPAELLILDEPTNHLDLEGIAFLEDFVQRYRGGVVAVSHDRRFLDTTCRSILEVEGGRARLWKGNWSSFAQQRDAALLAQARAYKDQQEWVAKEMEFIRRNMAGRMSAQAKGRLKRLQRLALIDRPKRGAAGLRLAFRGGRGQAGQSMLEAENLTLKAPGGRVLIEHASFRLCHGEVLGIMGKNGAGKSTLLRCLHGDVAPAAGEVLRAVGARGGYFSQEMQDLPSSGTVLDALRQVDPKADEKTLRDHLALFLFTGDDAERPVDGLSGGEKRRLCLARLVRGHFDFLCLDEPTNHLDISTREALEQALSEYGGAVLAVSHDRAFVEKLVDRVLLVEDGGVRVVDGGWEQVMAAIAQARAAGRSEERRQEQARPVPAAEPDANPKRVRNPLMFGRLEQQIMALEEERKALRVQMELPESYGSRETMQQLLARDSAIEHELKEAYARWETWS